MMLQIGREKNKVMKNDKKDKTEDREETQKKENSDDTQDKVEEIKEIQDDESEATADKEDKDKKHIEYLKDQLARSVADFRNLEKRHQEEKQEFRKFANRDLLVRLLPAFDMLFLAGKYVEDEGVKLTIKRIEDVFSEIGVKRVETEGKQFDPIVMECVETQSGEDGKVLKEIKPGFTLNGKLLSPATVIVGSGNKEQ